MNLPAKFGRFHNRGRSHESCSAPFEMAADAGLHPKHLLLVLRVKRWIQLLELSRQPRGIRGTKILELNESLPIPQVKGVALFRRVAVEQCEFTGRASQMEERLQLSEPNDLLNGKPLAKRSERTELGACACIDFWKSLGIDLETSEYVHPPQFRGDSLKTENDCGMRLSLCYLISLPLSQGLFSTLPQSDSNSRANGGNRPPGLNPRSALTSREPHVHEHARLPNLVGHPRLHYSEATVSRPSILQIELALQVANDPRDVGAVQRAHGQHRHRPIRAALARVHPMHATTMHVGLLAGQVRDALDTLQQQRLQLLGGAGRLAKPLLLSQREKRRAERDAEARH